MPQHETVDPRAPDCTMRRRYLPRNTRFRFTFRLKIRIRNTRLGTRRVSITTGVPSVFQVPPYFHGHRRRASSIVANRRRLACLPFAFLARSANTGLPMTPPPAVHRHPGGQRVRVRHQRQRTSNTGRHADKRPCPPTGRRLLFRLQIN